jgi:cation transport regulator
MSYRINAELPESIKAGLPDRAQDLYRSAFNSAWSSARLSANVTALACQESAHRFAWSAVRRLYEPAFDGWKPKPR